MSAVKITCPHCGQVMAIDASRLPDKPVAYSCTRCEGRIVVEKAKLLATAESANLSDTNVQPQMRASGSPAKAEAQGEGPSLPRQGVIIGEDVEAMAKLSQALQPVGCTLDVAPTAAEARARALEGEVPPLIAYVAGKVDGAPYEPIQPIVTLPPDERRRTFILLVADNLTTDDGSEALIYEVNLILNKKDLPSVAEILSSGWSFYQRLYRSYFAATDGTVL